MTITGIFGIGNCGIARSTKREHTSETDATKLYHVVPFQHAIATSYPWLAQRSIPIVNDRARSLDFRMHATIAYTRRLHTVALVAWCMFVRSGQRLLYGVCYTACPTLL